MIEVDSNLKEKFQKVRDQSLKICNPLKPEDYVVQPVTDVSPPKWHLGHTTWFFEEFVLKPHKPDYQLFDSDFSYMFNSYYETVGERVLRPNRGFMTRPGTEEIKKYRLYVDDQMEEFLNEEVPSKILDIIEIGINHEQQHQELLITDIKHILGINPLFPVYQTEKCPEGEVPREEHYIDFGEGNYEIGYNGDRFHFDNEKGIHKVYLHPFRILDRLVTNAEFMDFMESGGYNDFRLWMSDGWEWVNNLETKAPMYWHKIEGKWHRFTLNGLIEVDLAAPVTHISFYEADAFARWKEKRLPTEFEWEVACKSSLAGDKEKGNFMEDGYLEPVPRQEAANQMFGDVWEWTESAYRPYPYYQAAEGALGEYNGKFMINQMVLRGGSCATPRSHIRATYRNFWHPHLRWQFNGLRLAENV